MRLDIWTDKYKHDKKYLICDNYENVNNLIRKQNTYINNLESIDLKTLAKNVLIKHNAKINKIEEINIINTNVQTVLLNNLIKNNKYSFIPKESICEATLREILSVINVIRSAHIIKNDEELKDINLIIADYEKVLEDNNYLDEVLLYKKAIDILNNDYYFDNSYYAILDYVNEKLTYIESTFLKSLKKDIEVIDIEDSNKTNNYKLLNVYGEANSIEKVLKDIKINNLSLGDCQIVLANSAYEANIRSVLESRGIDYSYTSSYSNDDYFGIEFIHDFLDWIDNDYSYKIFMKLINNKAIYMIDPLIINEDNPSKAVFQHQLGIDAGISYGIDRYNDFLDKIKDTNKRHEYLKLLYANNPHFKEELISDEAFEKEFIPFMQDVVETISEDIIYKPGLLLERIANVYNKYQLIDKKNTLLMNLSPTINALKMMEDTDTIKESILVILDKLKYLVYQDTLENNSIQICNLDNVLIFFRKYVYIIGMNYDDFEPKLRDNPIVSNQVLSKCLDNKYYIKLSLNKAKEKKEILIKSLSTFSGDKVTFIMSNYNTKEFRETIPSIFYNNLKKLYGEEVCESKYDNLIYLDNNQRLKYDLSNNCKEKFVEKEVKDGHNVYKLLKPLTASQLNTIMKCPLQYIYSLNYFFKDEEERNSYEWLNPSEKGNLFHYVFEDYCRSIINVASKDLSEDVYLDRFEKIFGEKIKYFKDIVVCPNSKVFEMEKQEYHDQMLRYLEMMHLEFKTHHISVRKVEAAFDFKRAMSKKLSIDENGDSFNDNSKEELIISFKANTTIDREDYLENDDEIRIVDYKTARNKYDKKKMEVNMQWFVYPFLEGAQRFEYHFPCVDKEEDIFGIIKVNEFDKLPQEVGKKLFDFFVLGKIDVLENDDEDDDTCKYCSYKSICLKKLAIKRGGLND